jgi:hypothetical protein
MRNERVKIFTVTLPISLAFASGRLAGAKSYEIFIGRKEYNFVR